MEGRRVFWGGVQIGSSVRPELTASGSSRERTEKIFGRGGRGGRGVDFKTRSCKQNLHLAVEWHTVLEWYRPTKRRKTVLLTTIGQPPRDRQISTSQEVREPRWRVLRGEGSGAGRGRGRINAVTSKFLDGRLLKLALRGGYREGVDSMAPSPPKKKKNKVVVADKNRTAGILMKMYGVVESDNASSPAPPASPTGEDLQTPPPALLAPGPFLSPAQQITPTRSPTPHHPPPPPPKIKRKKRKKNK